LNIFSKGEKKKLNSKARKKLKLNVKLIVILMLVSIVPLAIVVTIDTTSMNQKLSSETDAALSSQSHSLAEYANDLLQGSVDMISQFAKSPASTTSALEVGALDMSTIWDTYEGANYDNDENMKNNKTKIAWNPDNDIDPEYSTYMDNFAVEQGFAEIFVTDARGYTYASSESIPGDFLQYEEGWWVDTLATEDGIFYEFGYDDSTGQFLMDICVEINLLNGTFVGIIKAGLDIGSISEKVSAMVDSEDIDIFSIDTNGDFFMHSTESLVGTQASETMTSTHNGNKALLALITAGTATNGKTTIKINSSFYRASYHSVETFGISLLAVKNQAILDTTIAQQTLISGMIALVVAVTVAVISFFVSRIFTKPIIKLKETANKIAAGEYVEIGERYSTNDEIGELSESFSKMTQEILESKNYNENVMKGLPIGILTVNNDFIVDKINYEFTKLTGVNEEDILGKKCHEVLGLETCNTENCPVRIAKLKTKVSEPQDIDFNGNGNHEADKAILRLIGAPLINENNALLGGIESFQDVTFEKQILIEVEKATETISSSVEQLSSNAEEVSASSENIASTQQQLSRGSSEQVIAITEMQRKFGDLSKGIRNIREKVENIGQVADLIKGIASQTNMLALNAAIEAARAGEAGRGFNVVADQVRKLADESRNAVANTEEMLAEIDVISKQQEGGALEILKSMDNIATIAEESSSSTEEAAAAAEEQASSMESVTELVQNLMSTVQNLNTFMDSTNDHSDKLDTSNNTSKKNELISEETESAF
jgi:methyl-accepting chemotaxis protein